MSDASTPDGSHFAGDGPPWRPPRPLEPTPRQPRTFDVAGQPWLAWVAGGGVGGTGSYNLALIESVQFAPADAPAPPQREVLVALGAFAGMHDEELVALHAKAQRIGPRSVDDARPVRPAPQRGRGPRPQRG